MTDSAGGAPDLGIGRAITRRDLLHGIALAAPLPLGDAVAAAGATEPGGYYPPLRNGLRAYRWPHGEAPEYNPLWDAATTPAEAPNVIGRSRCGRIAIASSDAGRAVHTVSAIDQAWRAVGELGG